MGEGVGLLAGAKRFDRPNIPNTPTDRALLLWVMPAETANQIETKERRDGLPRKLLATWIDGLFCGYKTRLQLKRAYQGRRGLETSNVILFA